MSSNRSRTRVAAAAAAAGGVAVATGRLLRRGRVDTTPPPAAEHAWTCTCGQPYRVIGGGRHQIFWLAGAGAAEPVLDGACPHCERPLPRETAAA